jgi:plastocyanin
MVRIRAAASLAALVLALAACGSGSPGDNATVEAPPSSSQPGAAANASTIAGLPANNHGTADVTGKSTVSIQAGNYYFEPSVLKGAPGQKLTLHVVNETSTAHNITVDPLHVNSDLDGHATIDAKVTMPASGVLSFWCEYHKSVGMVGGLLVSGSVAGGPAGTVPTGTSPSPSSSSGSGYGGSYGNG